MLGSRQRPGRLPRRPGWVGVLACAALATWMTPAQAQEFAPVELRFVVAEEGGVPVVDAAWLAERVLWANRIFGPADVSFVAAEAERLPDGHLRVVSRRDRHRLGALATAGVINVFVVGSLADVDVPGRLLRGVHWRSNRAVSGHFVILSRIAGRTVLAHELGHFYGNPHSPTPGNIMSYDRGGVEVPFFDVDQLRRVRRFATRFVRSGELRASRQP